VILEETYSTIKLKYGKRFNTVVIEQFVAGIYFMAVKLSSGYCGMANTNLNASDTCTQNRKSGFGDFTPGHFSGHTVAELFNHKNTTRFIKTVQLAAMNAISAELIGESQYKTIENLDPIELLDLESGKKICLIGAFLSYMKKISASNSYLNILELNKNAVPEEYQQFLVADHLAEKTILGSDIVIITGASLANNTIDALLDKIPPHIQVVLVGPTSSLLPDVLFKHGVNIIGSTRIIDDKMALQLIAEGAAGFHLFNKCAIKTCIVNES
jgi:uncharacterized protein (DUF4213/DUF364 family)